MQRLQALKCQIHQNTNPICMFLFSVVILILAIDNLAVLAWVLARVVSANPALTPVVEFTSVPDVPCAPTLLLLPSQGHPGAPIQVQGECWPAFQDVTLALAPAPTQTGTSIVITTLMVDMNGRFSQLISVPVVGPWLRWSQVAVQATDASGEHAVSAIYLHSSVPNTAVPISMVTPTSTVHVVEVTVTSPPSEPTATQEAIVAAPTAAQPTATPSPLPTDTPPAMTSTPVVPTITLPPSPTATSTPLPVPVTGVWQAEFFRGTSLGTVPVVVEQHPEIRFHWEKEPPTDQVASNNYSVRWTRYEDFESGNYRFFAMADDGIRVWLDNQELISEWHAFEGRTYTADRVLGLGVHKFVVEYYEQGGKASVDFWWEQAGLYPDWRGSYYDNAHLQNAPRVVRNDEQISFDWGDGAPDPLLPADNFSVRWTRTSYYDAGTYQFDMRVDDGVRLYIDGVQVGEDAWCIGAARDVHVQHPLSAGDHTVTVEYFDATGAATAHLKTLQLLDNSD